MSFTRQDSHIPTRMKADNRPHNLGKSINDDTSRLDGVAKVTGAAKYGIDHYLDDQLFVAFIRCPYGKADLLGVDQQAASAVPGVVEVTVEGDGGQYHGDTVGYIVAESKTALRRGMKAAVPRWRVARDITTDIVSSGNPQPRTVDEVEQRLQNVDHIVEAVYSTPVQTHSSLETHGVTIDHNGERAIVYASTQGTSSVADGITNATGLPRARVEVRCEYVGGGFGSKFGPGKEGLTAMRVAEKYNRPVMLFVDRAEEHLDTGNRPSSHCYAKIGIASDGTVVGGTIQTWGGIGVGGGGGGVRFPSGRYPGLSDSLTRSRQDHQDVRFNGGAPRAMRAPGWPQGAFVEELVVDELATGIGMDPLLLRMKLDDEADRRAMYEQGAEMIGWSRRQRTGTHTGSIRRGFGMGSASWGSFPARADAHVVIHKDGSVEARTGTQDIGTGQRTVMGVIAAEQLGVPLERVSVDIGSSRLPPGPASGGSVTAPNTAPAMMAAADDAQRQLMALVAEQLNANASDLRMYNGEVLHHNEPVMRFSDACRFIRGDSLTGRGSNDDDARRKYRGDGHSHGAQFVELLVDTETGVIRIERIIAIQACGKVVSRKTAESQIIGGVIQGLSFALFEDRILDPNLGAMVNPNLEWYKIAGAADMPSIVPVLWERGQTGVRSLGEPTVVPTAGAIACALYNAIGRPVRSLPLTPDKVFAALDGGAA